MRHLIHGPSRGLGRRRTSLSLFTWFHPHNHHRVAHKSRRHFLSHKAQNRRQIPNWPLAVLTGGLFVWWLYPAEEFALLSESQEAEARQSLEQAESDDENQGGQGLASSLLPETAWNTFAQGFESFSMMTDLEWVSISDTLADYILPDWSKFVPGYVRKLQKELSMSPGSLADEIWAEAHDPIANPEIRYSANVRVSPNLCDEEKEFLSRRRKYARAALARYLDLEEADIHPEDVPTIALCGSGGGVRALVAGTGSMMAAEEDGLFDCVTYTAGVSGSCWLQMLYLTSFNNGKISSLLEHLKSRASTHIAYPPFAFHALTSAPTNKYLLSGMVEKLKGDAKADFGLVDIYGLLLAARYLVPRGELAVNDRDFKLSNQREFIKYGQLPLPIYTAVRHEIPDLESAKGSMFSMDAAETAKEEAKKEAWFQWFEITPYEFFCEEFGAGIPTWAMGRQFSNGKDVPHEHGFHLPEIRAPLLLGMFGSAFCATLSHYYREVRPLVRSMSGLGAVDELIWGRNEDLSKVHPIDPAKIPNFAYQMDGQLPKTTPESIYKDEYLQLMDAGMSNNLPIYPLLRPGRDVDVLIAFDASADIKTENWLSVADGYAKQRGIKGWPLGIGWPKANAPVSKTEHELEDAQVHTAREAEDKLQKAKAQQEKSNKPAANDTTSSPKDDEPSDLGYCTVWVGTTEERTTENPPPRKAMIDDTDTWQLQHRDAGIAVVYLPFLANEAKVPGIAPETSDFLSTWNFIYTPEQIEQVVRLARANYNEGKQQVRATVRAVYERKKLLRLEGEKRLRQARFERTARKAVHREGDQFS